MSIKSDRDLSKDYKTVLGADLDGGADGDDVFPTVEKPDYKYAKEQGVHFPGLSVAKKTGPQLLLED